MKSSSHSLIPFLPLFSITFNCRLSQFSAATVISGTRLNSNSSCVRSSLYSLGADPQKTPLSLLLRVDSLLQRYVYCTVALLWPTENSACNTAFIDTWRHSLHDAFLCCSCTDHYLATAVSLPLQFMLRANTPQYVKAGCTCSNHWLSKGQVTDFRKRPYEEFGDAVHFIFVRFNQLKHSGYWSPCTLWTRVCHNVCRQAYGREALCKYVLIYHGPMNTGSMLKIGYDGYIRVYVTNWWWRNLVPTADGVYMHHLL
jgi:hypothetical protein